MTDGRSSSGHPDAAVDDVHPDEATSDTETSATETPATESPTTGTTGEGTSTEDVADDTPTTQTPIVRDTQAPPEAAVGGTPTSATGARAEGGDEEWADAEDKAYRRELRKGLSFGLAGGLIVGVVVALLLGAFVYPGYLLGPGDPQDTAAQVTSALAAKDATALDRLTCRSPQGEPVSQLDAQSLQVIGGIKASGPTTLVIDTEARAPVDLTLSAQGQTQTLPSELVLGQVQGDWCFVGLAQRQQQ